MRLSRNLTLIGLICLFPLSACEKQEQDPQIQNLQRDVKQLSEENRKLLEEIRNLHKEMVKQNTPQTEPVPKESPPSEKMTVDKMKAQVAPLLKEVIKKIKDDSETPKHGDRYGMRVEYDLSHAFYGLVRSENPEAPYFAKVLVRYEKFLESEQVSRSYGVGSSSFLFAYRANRWVLEHFE